MPKPITNNPSYTANRKRSISTSMSMRMSSSNNNNNDDDRIPIPFLGTTREDASTTSTSSSSTTLEDKNKIAALEEAKALKEMAQKARLEAERLDITLTLDKIAKLEKKLERIISSSSNNNNDNGNAKDNNNDKSESEDEIRRQIIFLKEHLDEPKKNNKLSSSSNTSTTTTTMTSTTTATSSVSTTLESSSSSTSNNDDDNNDETEIQPLTTEERTKRVNTYRDFPSDIKQLFADAVNVDDVNDVHTIIERIHQEEEKVSRLTNNNDDNDDDSTDEEKKKRDLTPLEFASARAGLWKLPPLIQRMVAETIGLDDASNATEVVLKMYEAGKIETNSNGVQFNMASEGSSTTKNGDTEKKKKKGDKDLFFDDMDGAVELFLQLPAPVRNILAEQVGEGNQSNSTIIVQKLIEGEKMKPTKNGIEFMLDDGTGNDLGTIGGFESENDRYVKGVLPAVMRKENQTPSKETVDIFFSKVLGKRNFNPNRKPEAVPGGYIIRGDNMLGSSDELVASIDEALKETNITDEVQFYFMKDPTLITQEEVDFEAFELPVILITGSDITPDTNALVKPSVSLFGVLCIFGFALGSFFTNDALAIDEANAEFWFENIFLPLLGAMVLPQFLHEIAHKFVAIKDKFQIGTPTLVPSLQLGLQGCITPLKTPPKNLNSLFDFAISGPLVGMAASVALMYTGLETQVFMDAATQAQLPSLPVELVRSSSLASGIIEYLLGDGVLLSPDPTALVRLHPYAVGGFLGIVVNALNLLPIGCTDGGRISTALFGRGFSRVIRGFVVFMMVLAGLFGGDESNLLLFYAVYASIWQREPEITCQNEVDGIDDFRAILAFATAVLVGLALVPFGV